MRWQKGSLTLLFGLVLLDASSGSAAVEDQRAREIVDQYVVSTVGRDEQVIRQYIQQQEAEDRRLE